MARRISLVMGLIVVIIAIPIYVVLSKDSILSIPCLFHLMTGLNCSGCGITRSIAALIDGNFILAVRYNLLFILCLGPALIFFLCSIYRYIKDGTILISRLSFKWLLGLAILVLGFAVVRNLQFNIPIWEFLFGLT